MAQVWGTLLSISKQLQTPCTAKKAHPATITLRNAADADSESPTLQLPGYVFLFLFLFLFFLVFSFSVEGLFRPCQFLQTMLVLHHLISPEGGWNRCNLAHDGPSTACAEAYFQILLSHSHFDAHDAPQSCQRQPTTSGAIG
jgi:hypothetical protein